jgi:hypothetical protein
LAAGIVGRYSSGRACHPGSATLLESRFDLRPVDVLKEGRDVIGPFEAVIDHEGMLEYVHYQ